MSFNNNSKRLKHTKIIVLTSDPTDDCDNPNGRICFLCNSTWIIVVSKIRASRSLEIRQIFVSCWQHFSENTHLPKIHTVVTETSCWCHFSSPLFYSASDCYLPRKVSCFVTLILVGSSLPKFKNDPFFGLEPCQHHFPSQIGRLLTQIRWARTRNLIKSAI